MEKYIGIAMQRLKYISRSKMRFKSWNKVWS